MFWHPRAEPFVFPAHAEAFQVPEGRVALIQHGGVVTLVVGGHNCTFNVDRAPVWAAAGTVVRFRNDTAGLLLPADGR